MSDPLADALTDVAEAFIAALNKTDRPEERILCEIACECLQRQKKPRVTVNEPLLGGGKVADLKTYFGESSDRPLWLEAKPMYEGWEYWGRAAFFGKGPWADVSKLAAHKAVAAGGAVGIVVVMWTNGDPVAPDEAEPASRSRLTPGQVFYQLDRALADQFMTPRTTCQRSSPDGHEVVALACPC